MTAWQLVAITWPWEPSVVVGCAGLVIAYLVAGRPRRPAAALAFVVGVIVLLLALDSPLDTLADTYLFSAHMAQHLLLLLVVPPMLLLGLPASLLAPAWRTPRLRRLVRTLSRPAVAWGVGIGTIWVWHVPVLYNATLGSAAAHLVEHVSFLATGVVFWWVVLGPLREARLSAPAAALYLLAATLATSVLGILLTFTRVGLYPAYLHPGDPLGIAPLIRTGWGLSPEVDQQVGGLLMWIPGGLVYLVAMLGVLVRWFGAADEREEGEATGGRPSESGRAARAQTDRREWHAG